MKGKTSKLSELKNNMQKLLLIKKKKKNGHKACRNKDFFSFLYSAGDANKII